MQIIIILCALLLMATGPANVHGRSVTFFADGALVELESAALKGVLEVPLLPGMIEGSLRITPGSGTTIQRVDIVPAAVDAGKSEKELDALLEQKSRLGDRLQALTTREAIFTSAAKSQSAKAPRRTKTNPEPLQSIRQGTEFAIAQLEAVYTARRKTEQEIRRLDARITAAKNGRPASENRARIVISPLRGKVTLRYAVAGHGWTPRYDIYLNGSGSARVKLSGQFPGTFNGYLLQASPADLADSATARVFPVQSAPVADLATFQLPAAEEFFGTGMLSSFSFELKNTDRLHLPAGTANIYRTGEYVGRVRFEGLSSGRSRKISAAR